MRQLGIAMAAAVVTCTSAIAAQVSPETGETLVNTGSGFKPISGPTEVASGAQVMVRPGGSAFIVYSDACSTRVGSERVWAVQAAAPCSAGKTTLDFTGRMSQNGETGMPNNGWDFWTWATFGVITIGVTAVAINEFSDDEENKPTSP